MKTVEEIEAEVAAASKFWWKIWFAIVAAFAIADIGFGLPIAGRLVSIILFPAMLFWQVKRAGVAGDQYQILSSYRMYAIMMTAAVVGVLVKDAAESEGYHIGISTFYVLFLSGGVGLLALTLYDRYIARGDAE